MELAILRSLMDKEFYDDHRGAKCPDRIFSSDGKKIKQAIDAAMENYGRAVEPDEIEAIFMANNPSLTTAQKTAYSAMFDSIRRQTCRKGAGIPHSRQHAFSWFHSLLLLPSCGVPGLRF